MLTSKSVAIVFSIAILVISLSVTSRVYAADPAIVLGSYGNLENAEQARRHAQAQLLMDASILQTEIRSAISYRVVIRHPNARALVSELKKKGYKDAWFLADAASDTLPVAAPPETTVSSTPVTIIREIKEAAPEPTSNAAIPASVTLAKKILIEEATGGGVDATIEPLNITKLADVDIKIDGKLDEALWADVPTYDNMSVVQPDLLIAPRHATQTRIFYTDEGIYVGILAEQPADKLIPRLSSRDADLNRDGTTFYLDTSGEGLYGFFFGVNLGGTLIDGTLLPERQLSRLWDGAWYGSSAKTADGYSTEMFLPWSMMSMPDGTDLRRMAFSVSRTVAYLDEEWQWPALPVSKPRFMSGLQPIQLEQVAPRQQLAFYPFSAATVDNMREETSYRVGMDIFWRPSTNLQLTATVKPDFGTVESDDVVINLTDFEVFFPEKRLFFLEGNDTFITSPRSQSRSSTQQTTGARKIPSTFFLAPTTLVNTRRIGGPAIDPVIPPGVDIPDVELGKPTLLIGAAKVTGQKGPFRYGAMFASEEDTKFYGTDANDEEVRIDQVGRDFGVLRFLAESTKKGRRSLGWISTIVSHPSKDAITHGVDAHYLSPNGTFFWDAQLMASDLDDGTENIKGYGGFIDLNYIPKQGDFHRFTYDHFDDTLDVSDFGFIRRNDVTTFRYTFSRTNSQLEKIRTLSNSLSFSHEYNGVGQAVRSSIFNRNIVTLNNRNQITTVVMLRPAQWDDRNSDGNGAYRTEPGGVLSLSFGSATSKVLSASIGINAMTEPLGDISYIGTAGITYKPNDRFSLDLDYSYRRTDHWMIHLAGRTMGAYDATHIQPKIAMDIFLSARQQLRFSLQWVGIKARAQDLYQIPEGDGSLEQITDGITESTYDFTISRLITQLRYRWEIAPLSDLFLVYTRGSNLPSSPEDGFNDLFHDALTDPLVDRFVIKLRYRFGN
ncbi:MAG: DUF5916 domain-containing protein [bacterium]|nr:hypothetical protein [Gammaproteobacteria bacterium]HIL97211.1 hypothetical protein [Pseudomonadales bacterium]